MRKYYPLMTFLKEAIMHPRAMGAVLPSSRYLAKAMLDQVTLGSDELIIELGSGTGAITQAILEKKISPKQIIAIEYMPALAEKLRQRFPDIHVIHGSAVELERLLEKQTQPIGAMISGLPLRSLSKTVSHTILSQITKVLVPHGQYIQFTYDIRTPSMVFCPKGYRLDYATTIWRNLPPAKVCRYTRKIDDQLSTLLAASVIEN